MSLAIHTTTPLLPLTRMVGDTANIEVGKAAAGGADCFYGWAEVQHTNCLPHHIVWGCDDQESLWIAKTLIRLGHQVVVTAPDNPDDQFGDHHVVTEMPMAYDDAHAH